MWQTKITTKKFIADIQNILISKANNKEGPRYQIFNDTKEFIKSKQINCKEEINILKAIKNDNSIRITSTDKPNKIAILNMRL